MKHPVISMSRLLIVASLALAGPASLQAASELNPAPRPPMVPLIVHNPFFGIWSPSDTLNSSDTRHWTNSVGRLQGLIRIDDQTFRVIGSQPSTLPALPQTGMRLFPTRTVYTFANPQIQLTLTFLTPVLPDDIELLARPLSYVVWDVNSADGKDHAVSLYLAAGAELAANAGDMIQAATAQPSGLVAAKVGTVTQPVLGSSGDDHRINWGYAWIAAPAAQAVATVGDGTALATAFASTGKPTTSATYGPNLCGDGGVIAVSQSLGTVNKPVSAYQMVAYDEVASLTYFRQKLQPYWRRNGAQATDLLALAVKDYPGLAKRCSAFDTAMAADAEHLGGPKYAYLCALAYRQALAANGLAADANGAPLMMPKENSSNGCIATIDVHFPMIPEFLLFFPSLAKATLVPPFDYSASPQWPYPYAPHDLGTYPLANGQVYGMGGSDGDRMPVEESGNLILMIAAVAHVDGNANFAGKWWPQLTAWVGYLEKVGFDPANQLCTDDFAGHLAHNSNLSVKSILAIAAYGQLAGMRGDKPTATKYQAMAKDFALKWMKAADDGDHYNLAFDRPNTWSLKYNLVWDRILGLNTFPLEVARKEMTFYRSHLNRFGLPLDSRSPQTKSDWSVWCASLTNKKEDLVAIIEPLYDFYSQVPERRAMVDWYNTQDGKMIGFTARSVVGGVFLPFLYNAALWKKWAGADKANPKTHIWAAQPKAPVFDTLVVPGGDKAPAIWRYTTDKPSAGWEKPGFDAAAWREGKSGFGSPGTPGTTIGTEWRTSDIWLQRDILIPANAPANLGLWIHHDDEVEIYIDGLPALAETGFTTHFEAFVPAPAAKAKLKPGATVHVAIHTHQDQGGQCIDLGIISIK